MLTSMPRNYTGDVLNFGLAKEQYAALHPEKAERIKFVIVGDDVAVGRAQGAIVGRRYENINNCLSAN
jgi:triose/dihydroxyacetone kinase / FAD-AMP lyase (cyclizing)